MEIKDNIYIISSHYIIFNIFYPAHIVALFVPYKSEKEQII